MAEVAWSAERVGMDGETIGRIWCASSPVGGACFAGPKARQHPRPGPAALVAVQTIVQGWRPAPSRSRSSSKFWSGPSALSFSPSVVPGPLAQAGMTRVLALRRERQWCLELGCWSLSGAWGLALGALFRPLAGHL